MEPGALIRKHSVDTIILCLFICISFFMGNTSYPVSQSGPDNIWFASLIATDYSDHIGVMALTSLSASHPEYNRVYTTMGVSLPNGGSEGGSSPCAAAPQSIYRSLSRAIGTYSASSSHYYGYDSCSNKAADLAESLTTTGSISIYYFYANPQAAPVSGTSTLYWSTFGGSVTINGTAVSTAGSMQVNPSSTTTYTLVVTNPSNSQSTTTVVRKNEPLNANYYKYSVRHEKGVSAFYPYMPVEQESVNSANGNLHFTVPLLSRPGRNGLGINLALAYNSKIWDFYNQGTTLYATIPEYDSWVGLGWTLTMGRIIDDSAHGYYYVTTSDGSNHTLQYYGGAWRSVDSTYMIYDPAIYKLTLKGGFNITFASQDAARPYIRYATKHQDTNGNYLDITYSTSAPSGGRIYKIEDTLVIPIPFFEMLDSSYNIFAIGTRTIQHKQQARLCLITWNMILQMQHLVHPQLRTRRSFLNNY